jgi:ketosteroid isomerase-like protein
LVSGATGRFADLVDDDIDSSGRVGRVGRHSTIMALTADPSQHPAVFAAAFNSGDPSAVEQVYEDLAVLVAEPGRPVTGSDRAMANARFLGLGLPIDVRPRHVYTAGDIALLIVDWKSDGTAPDGTRVHLSGTATDVTRRGPEGTWRYIIDNPFGTA